MSAADSEQQQQLIEAPQRERIDPGSQQCDEGDQPEKAEGVVSDASVEHEQRERKDNA